MARRLSSFPLSGRDCEKLAPGLRSFIHKSYVIYYFVLDHGQGIEIAHILHGARRHERMMQDEKGSHEA
ncbi:MAG: type II toxin-antitoxin system RelE/ParE family toxin [Alphaproteobacteria bacterium]|nr:type II toxin-antitoxin system RelE/ParE family toxin [Alphaproteobacteria bacterium]